MEFVRLQHVVKGVQFTNSMELLPLQNKTKDTHLSIIMFVGEITCLLQNRGIIHFDGC
jgi:hypothetical protein